MKTEKQRLQKSKERFLKINTGIRANGPLLTTVPEIKMAGEWLERLGFCAGGTVKVTFFENNLLITLMDPGPWTQNPEGLSDFNGQM